MITIKNKELLASILSATVVLGALPFLSYNQNHMNLQKEDETTYRLSTIGKMSEEEYRILNFLLKEEKIEKLILSDSSGPCFDLSKIKVPSLTELEIYLCDDGLDLAPLKDFGDLSLTLAGSEVLNLDQVRNITSFTLKDTDGSYQTGVKKVEDILTDLEGMNLEKLTLEGVPVTEVPFFVENLVVHYQEQVPDTLSCAATNVTLVGPEWYEEGALPNLKNVHCDQLIGTGFAKEKVPVYQKK